MNLIKRIGLFSFIFTLFACENEVDINAEFNEVTTVFGLLDSRSDTQFVKIGKTFLDDELNALELAGDPNRLYYDSLNVQITEESTNRVINLRKIEVPKEPGLFTQDRNEVYITTEALSDDRLYSLKVTKPDGSVTTGETETIRGVAVVKPTEVRGSRTVIFVSSNGAIRPFTFTFATRNDIGEFDMNLYFRYIEIKNNDSTEKQIVFPLGTVINAELKAGSEYKVTLNGTRFFQAIESQIPISSTSPKRILPENNIVVEVNSADGDYSLYRDVNGPIDGLSQTRAEYTNISNGVGLFASRRKQFVNATVNDDTENYIIANYGDRSNQSQFRGFAFP